MGDSERWPEASGLSPEGSHSFSAALATFHSKGDEWWAKAELRAAELITSIQPNPASELRRQAVVNYVTKLIQSCFNCQTQVVKVVEVVRFGSVPLKTYLPDGDIDLTVVSPNPEVKRTWYDDVHNVLQKEIANPNAEFQVTEVHGVPDAEVKIIKIYVAKLLVDVSFDQLGGLCTLCFLEEVDRLIGDDHLFKRSIILVKAWCYYESRLLGAASNLMSTYALETLVLYIFHIFHASLRGPLQVLYLFLEFFSSFDWDKYCVSLSSPILLASFSEETERQSIIAEDLQKLALLPRREGGELLFTKAFLDACERAYGGGLMPVNQIAKPNKFAVKSLNIIDPLRSTNNLGRSVNQGNCARIRRAFVLGARTLRNILHASEADVSTELNQFFKNCNLRSNERPDVPCPRSWQTKLPDGVQKIGGAKRDTAKTERNDDSSPSSVSQNGDHLQQTSPNHFLPVESTYPDPKEPTVRDSPREVLEYGLEYEGAPILWSKPCASAVELASGREEKVIESAGNLKSTSAKEVALNSGNAKIAFNKDCGSNGLISHSPHIDEEPMRIPSQICSLDIVSDRLPVASGTYVEDELSPGMFSERNGSGHKLRGKLERRDFLVANMDSAGVSKQGTTVNGNHGTQHRTNGSTSSCSRIDSEEEEECSSQSSSKGEATASENSSTIVVLECRGSPSHAKEGLLPLPCRPESFESTRNGSSSLLQDRPVDQHSTSDFAAQTEVQAPSYSKQLVSVGNEEEREFSAPVEAYKQTGNGCEYPGIAEVSQSKVPRRKGRTHQQSGLQGKELEGSGIVHGKSKRGSGKSKGAWSVDDGKEKVHVRAGLVAQDGGMSQLSSSTAGGSSCPVPASGYQHVHPPRHSSSDATGGAHFKPSQSRPYPNATGPGSFRHPLANYQFDPGTARMTAGGSGPSHSSPPQYLPSYIPGYSPPALFPPGFPHVMYSPGMNIHKRNSPAKGDGSSGINAKNRTGQDTNGSNEVLVENSGDSPRNKSQSKASEQSAVGIVERLEAEGIMASTSSKRSQTVASRNAHGADPGGSSPEFLTGNLKGHLDSLAYGRFCEYSCSPSLNQIVYPAYASEQHAHKHGSWEGPGRPDAALRAQLVAPQFYASGPGWFPPFHQAGYFQYLQPFWGTRGVELSPRPRGTGTYLPNTQLRQNIRAAGRGQNRGVGQNGSSQQEDKYHQSREHESNHHFHGSHHRAPTNKDEHAQGVYGSSNRVVENRTVKTERVRDPHPHPKHHDFVRASASHNSHPSEPSVSGLRANPGELPQPSELVLRTDCDLSTVPLDVRKSCNDTSGQAPIVMLSGLSESNVSSELLAVEFLPSGEALLDQGGKRSGPQLKRSASVGHSYDLVKSDDPAAISSMPTTVGEVIPTATTQRNGRPTYHMKEEDFPPLGGRRVNRAEITIGGTGSIANGIASNLGRYVSL